MDKKNLFENDKYDLPQRFETLKKKETSLEILYREDHEAPSP